MIETQRIRYLDGWRGAAILALLLGHFVGIPFINCGRLGVEMFFVLSGSLMGRILFLKMETLPTFYKRRISRILPAAYVFLTIYILYGLLRHRPFSLIETSAAYLFWINYARSLVPINISFDHLWSLAVEEHTYIILSLVALLHRKRGFSPPVMLLLLIGVCFISMVFHGITEGWDYYRVFWRSDVRAASILMGALFVLISANMRVRPTAIWNKLSAPAPLLILLLFGILLQIGRVPDPIKYTLGTCLLAFFVANMQNLSTAAKHFFSNPFFVQMGIWSYSIYLWQQPFITRKFAGLPIALCLGIASFYLVEQPARKYLNRVWAKHTIEVISA